jgi:3-deoxy-manno-octulosonate cytidylyltransferase (CMP-KDO synthetase)
VPQGIRMTVFLVVVSRFQDVLFPGRPLAFIKGRRVIERTTELVRGAATLCPGGEVKVIVATDDERVAEHVHSMGLEPVVLSGACSNKTIRAYEAVRTRASSDDIVVIIEGNQVVMPPWVIKATVNALVADSSLQIVAPVVRLTQAAHRLAVEARRAGEPAGVFVVRRLDGDALFLSRSIIPCMRTPREPLPVYRQVAVEGYRFSALEVYQSLPIGELEESEGIEQLRGIENGLRVRTIEVDYRGRTVIALEEEDDIKRIEAIIDREGELE